MSWSCYVIPVIAPRDNIVIAKVIEQMLKMQPMFGIKWRERDSITGLRAAIDTELNHLNHHCTTSLQEYHV